MVRRLGTARTYGLGTVVTVLAVLALDTTWSFEALSLFRLLSGVSGGWIFVTGVAMAAAIAAEHPGKSGVLIGLFYAGGGFGVALTGLIFPQWLQHFGPASWRDIWFLLGALGALLPPLEAAPLYAWTPYLPCSSAMSSSFNPTGSQDIEKLYL